MLINLWVVRVGVDSMEEAMTCLPGAKRPGKNFS